MQGSKVIACSARKIITEQELRRAAARIERAVELNVLSPIDEIGPRRGYVSSITGSFIRGFEL